MRKNLLWSQTTFSLLTIIVAITTLISCKTQKSRLSGAIGNRKQVSAEAKDMLNEDSVRFTRTDTYTSGVLTFSTKIKVKCEIEYWTKNTQNHPQTKPCQESDGATEFQEKLETLPSDQNISLKLYLWPTDQSKKDNVFFRIDENADFSAVKFQQLITGRIVLPLKSMEVYEVNLEGTKKLDELAAMLTTKPGCVDKKVLLPNPFIQSNKPLTINNLSTTGFGEGPAKVHPLNPNRLSVFFDLLQMNQDWNWHYKYGELEHQLVTKAPGYLNSLKIIGGGKEFAIKNKNLNLLDDVLSLTGTEREFSWAPQNLSDGALLYIQFSGQKTGSLLTCIFPAADSKGSMPDNLASKLPADVYDFIAIMQSSQIVKPADGNSPTWVITAQDWRYSKLAWKTTL